LQSGARAEYKECRADVRDAEVADDAGQRRVAASASDIAAC